MNPPTDQIRARGSAVGVLLHYARRYRRGWGVIVLATLAAGLVALAQPWPMQVVVDQVLSGKARPPRLDRVMGLLPGGGSSRAVLAAAVLSGLALVIIGILVETVLTRAWVRVGQGMVHDLSRDLFARVQRRSLVFHGRNSVGDLMSRVAGDSWVLYQMADSLLITPARALLMLAAVLVVMARLDGKLTLVALAAAPLMALTTWYLRGRIRAVSRDKRRAEGQIQAHVQQTLSGMGVVQAFAQERRTHERFVALSDTAMRATLRGTLLAQLAGLGTSLATTLGTAAVLVVGASHVLGSTLSIGTLLVFVAYLASLQSQVTALIKAYAASQGMAGQVERVLEVLGSEAEVREPRQPRALNHVRGDLEFESVTFGYEPARPVLRDLSLAIPAGSSLALVGTTGAGKSTLAALVPRLFDPWSGSVKLDGVDIRELALDDLRRGVALVLQEPFLFPATVAENIAYGKPGATVEQIEAAARAANAHEFIERLEGGYQTIIGERGATLSGGQRQRLAIARALLKDAPVLVLDEPTSALDASSEALVMEAIKRLASNRTSLIIAHRLSTVRHADRIAVLDSGRVAELGTHQQLIAAGGLYARLFASQGDRALSTAGAALAGEGR